MGFELRPDEGEYLVRLARSSIEAALGSGKLPSFKEVSDKLKIQCGVFVTINEVHGSSHRLRECIGFPYPVEPLVEAVADSAVSAALRDPRLSPVTRDEMDSIVIEISVLTPPEAIEVESPMDYPRRIEVGNHGLIISRGANRGLLLPQVAVDWGWDAEEFLTQCCLKAYLPPDSWLLPETEVQRFRAIIYAEEKPRGAVKRVELKGPH